MNQQRRTKIVATVGPAIASREMMSRLVSEGVDVFRLNFSHGHHSDFAKTVDMIRSCSRDANRPVGILADIQGPKLRVGQIQDGQVELKNGSDLWISQETVNGGIQSDGRLVVSTGYRDFVKDVEPGQVVLLDDGLLAIKIVDKEPGFLKATVVNGGWLKPNKGINVPDANFSARSITEKDYDDILFCLDQNVDFIALSFVRSSQEIRHLKSFIHGRQKRIQVLAKIEMRDALNHLDEIVDASDGVLVARGDLAVEVGNERVPVLQKKIVRKCNVKGKSVIIATQMLMSMVDNPRPTRAEASDVANAVVDGADALMLSNETAVGKFPIETVQMMGRIIEEMEPEANAVPVLHNEWELTPSGQTAIALLQSAVRLSMVLKAKKIIVITYSGYSALLVSKCRPKNPILAITPSPETFNQLSLQWGMEALLMEDMESLMSQTSVFEAIGQRLLALNLCNTGDKIVITAGLPRLAHGATNTIKVHQVS